MNSNELRTAAAGITDFSQLIEEAPKGMKVAVAGASDEVVLLAVKRAFEAGIVDGGLLAFTKEGSGKTAVDMGLSGFDMITVDDDRLAADAAVEAVRSGRCGILMKGFVQTKDFMKAVLDKITGLKRSGVLSQVGIYQIEGMGRLILMADVGICITPDLTQKAQIVTGAAAVARAFGNPCPKVAALSSVEVVNPSIPGSEDARELKVMAERGLLGKLVLDGPLALDNAVSQEAAAHKGISSEVAGYADVLLAPDLNSGNMMAKAAVYFAKAKAAGVVTGAQCPIVLTSRADSDETKFNSIAVAAFLGSRG
ncbi:MAG TPA: phosphate acyltransferase [Bacillota bacterium]|nr:phosphate acyltransferase [Bacillota bacterium]